MRDGCEPCLRGSAIAKFANDHERICPGTMFRKCSCSIDTFEVMDARFTVRKFLHRNLEEDSLQHLCSSFPVMAVQHAFETCLDKEREAR